MTFAHPIHVKIRRIKRKATLNPLMKWREKGTLFQNSILRHILSLTPPKRMLTYRQCLQCYPKLVNCAPYSDFAVSGIISLVEYYRFLNIVQFSLWFLFNIARLPLLSLSYHRSRRLIQSRIQLTIWAYLHHQYPKLCLQCISIYLSLNPHG